MYTGAAKCHGSSYNSLYTSKDIKLLQIYPRSDRYFYQPKLPYQSEAPVGNLIVLGSDDKASIHKCYTYVITSDLGFPRNAPK